MKHTLSRKRHNENSHPLTVRPKQMLYQHTGMLLPFTLLGDPIFLVKSLSMACPLALCSLSYGYIIFYHLVPYLLTFFYLESSYLDFLPIRWLPVDLPPAHDPCCSAWLAGWIRYHSYPIRLLPPQRRFDRQFRRHWRVCASDSDIFISEGAGGVLRRHQQYRNVVDSDFSVYHWI
jgi:hypothetical protein